MVFPRVQRQVVVVPRENRIFTSRKSRLNLKPPRAFMQPCRLVQQDKGVPHVFMFRQLCEGVVDLPSAKPVFPPAIARFGKTVPFLRVEQQKQTFFVGERRVRPPEIINPVIVHQTVCDVVVARQRYKGNVQSGLMPPKLFPFRLKPF